MKWSFKYSAWCAMAWLATACGNAGQQAEEAAAPWSVSYEKVEVRSGDCDSVRCTYARFDIPSLEGGKEAARARINADMGTLVRKMVSSQLPEPPESDDLERIAASFVEGHELFELEFDEAMPWYLEVSGRRSTFTADYFVLHLQLSEYMGGAHPNTYIALQTYRLSDGAALAVTDVVDEDRLLRRAEAAFREKHALSQDAKLDDEGFFFEDGRFALPQNMALLDEGILLIYNPYEVAAYSMGITEIILPYEEAEP